LSFFLAIAVLVMPSFPRVFFPSLNMALFFSPSRGFAQDEDPIELLKLDELIAEGSFGTVYKVCLKKGTHKKFSFFSQLNCSLVRVTVLLPFPPFVRLIHTHIMSPSSLLGNPRGEWRFDGHQDHSARGGRDV
jgi:hypothetical protein